MPCSPIFPISSSREMRSVFVRRVRSGCSPKAAKSSSVLSSPKFLTNVRQSAGQKEYLIERVKKLLVPFLFGTICLMPIMTYIADKFNYSYDGSFFEHYIIFFTKYTDLIGADGGFSLGQFWFLLYLFIISIIGIVIITLLKRYETDKINSFWMMFLLGLPLPILSELLSVGGKSIAEYTYLFMVGYYIFSDEKIVNKVKKNSILFICQSGTRRFL